MFLTFKQSFLVNEKNLMKESKLEKLSHVIYQKNTQQIIPILKPEVLSDAS